MKAANLLKEEIQKEKTTLNLLPKRKTSTTVSSKLMTKAVPSQNTLNTQLNLFFAYGTYDIPEKMWYFLKKITKSSEFNAESNSVNDCSLPLKHTFRLPTEMKELNISVIGNVSYTGATNCNNTPPGYSVELKLDQNIIDTQSEQSKDFKPSNKYEKTVTLEGSMFNVPAGVHDVIINLCSICSSTVEFNTSSIINPEDMPVYISLTGYPSNRSTTS
eukprot:CAMPEP_0170514462 /NCGR_PEP_ID=MMETSP0209-20121228/1034_1 /TAXON_ID=665100 ORGANISM="Litonotus pictus, Strain P1" /NCGR_SAMPLE_ID=MMETSP0209 /ASSEMBLY_ACC=CAM_ASM_000301 /LENGTH=216 /DNA_ID=CAMNT_0010798559 /DNA_START=95 /DNA_END=745 /DNA_ORIENTATION=+